MAATYGSVNWAEARKRLKEKQEARQAEEREAEAARRFAFEDRQVIRMVNRRHEIIDV